MECFNAWGKLKRDDSGDVRVHPLCDHMLDVAACFLRIAECQPIRRSMYRTAGRALDARDLARLAVLAYLHDMGKANCGFQRRYWNDGNAPRGWPEPAGHGSEALLAFKIKDDHLLAGLPLDAMDTWGASTWDLWRASLSHHGRPLVEQLSADAAIWRPVAGYSPARTLHDMGAQIQRYFPLAFEPGGAPLPDAPAFAHLFAGLLQLADWLGSDERFFEYGVAGVDRLDAATAGANRAVTAIGLDTADLRAFLDHRPPSFATTFGVPQARPIQRALGESGHGPLLILEAETGSGKTEAALWRFASLFASGAVDSLYFALPTRVAASQIYRRVQDFAARLWPVDTPLVVRALPGYESADGNDKTALADYKVLWSDHPDDSTAAKRWAAESPKRFLAATIAVGTVDQALMAALTVRHAHLRHALLSRALLVVDEVHASDDYMGIVLEHLLRAHLGAGGHALLLSATLGSRARTRYQSIARGADKPPVPVPPLDRACALPYPALTDGIRMHALKGNPAQKKVHWQTLPAIDDPARIARIALDAAARGARVLVVRNTVKAAVATLRAVEAAQTWDREKAWLFNVGGGQGVSTLHHSRFSRQDRPLLDAEVERRMGKFRGSVGGAIVIGTQTLEQSLDIDADLLITDICPMDVLLQRVGRLHRHARAAAERPAEFSKARAWVLMPESGTFDAYLQRAQHGLGLQRGGGGVYADLRIVEATRRLIEAQTSRDIPRDNRELVERATHPDCLRAIEAELGGAWAELAQTLEGESGAKRAIGHLHALAYDTPFEALLPFDAGNKIATRLGAADRLVELDPPVAGPFGSPVHQLAIRHYLVPADLDAETRATDVAVTPGGFEFSLGSARFNYDRFGLERIEGGHPTGGTA